MLSKYLGSCVDVPSNPGAPGVPCIGMNVAMLVLVRFHSGYVQSDFYEGLARQNEMETLSGSRCCG